MNTKTIIFSLILLLSGCGEHALRGAGAGGASGAASGAVGGLFSALIFGGDPVEAAARGAVVGGATGATIGGISGSQADAKVREKKKAESDKIRARIGDDAFKGLTALVSCDHGRTQDYATSSKQSNNPNFAVSGYWLEVLNYADQAQGDRVDALLPKLISKDWDTASESEARVQIRALQGELVNLRERYELKANCEKSQ